MNIPQEIKKIATQAKEASQKLAIVKTEIKNKALEMAAQALFTQSSFLLEENKKDIDAAVMNKLTPALMDRLTLDEKRVQGMAAGLQAIAKLADPVGEILEKKVRPNGLEIIKKRVPLGVIFMIYESRPNVTADSAALCLKSGNAVILRGGKEALHSNVAIAHVLQGAFTQAGLPENALQLISFTDYEAVTELLKCEEQVNLVIPRGGEKLIRTVVSQSRIPVIKHYKGICHVYVDASANLKMAEDIVINAKTQRPGVCNAMETLLVHQDLMQTFLPKVIQKLKEKKVEIRGSKEVCRIVPDIKEAEEADWATEYLDLILSVKLVKNVEEAISHISRYGSGHSEAIITEDEKAAEIFLNEVDSSAVFVNASTRFNDGGEFGMGAEIGISTDKIHARGPMGLKELTSYKYVVRGNGQIRT